MARRERAKQVPIGAQRIGQHAGIEPVVLGARDGEAVAEAVELLRVEGEAPKAALKEGLDHRAARDLDGDPNNSGLGAGAANCRVQLGPPRHERPRVA